jgi:hypothetical protein
VKVSAPVPLVRSSDNGKVTKRAVLNLINKYVNSITNNSQLSEILTEVNKDVKIVLSETDGSAVLVNMYNQYTDDFDPFAGI